MVGEQGDQNPKIGFATPQPLFGPCLVSAGSFLSPISTICRGYWEPISDPVLTRPPDECLNQYQRTNILSI